jgi:hypothetical protein
VPHVLVTVRLTHARRSAKGPASAREYFIRGSANITGTSFSQLAHPGFHMAHCGERGKFVLAEQLALHPVGDSRCMSSPIRALA